MNLRNLTLESGNWSFQHVFYSFQVTNSQLQFPNHRLLVWVRITLKSISDTNIWVPTQTPTRLQSKEGSTGGRCGETVELDGRRPIINTQPHLWRHSKGIHEKQQLSLKERRKTVRRYDTTWPWGSTQLCGSTKSQKERVKAKHGKIECVIRCIMIRWVTSVSSYYPVG